MDTQRAKIKQRPSFGMAFMVNCGASSNLIRVDMPEISVASFGRSGVLAGFARLDLM